MKPDPEVFRKILLNAQQALQRSDRHAARRDFARAVVQVRVGHRFEQDLEVEGERTQGPRKSVEKTAL